jgi:hypothetical protein
MPVSAKALLIAACTVLAIGGGTALAYQIWWQTRGTEVVASLGDGTRYGAGRDSQACVTEALWRVKSSSGLIGFTDQVKNELFLDECLKAATTAGGFCTGVPPKSDTQTSAAWRAQTSDRYGLEGTLRQGLVTEIQDFCEADASAH